MRTHLNLPLFLLALSSLAGLACAQGAGFNYQGRLNDGTTLATGRYDFTFNVFDVAADGASLAGPIALDAVPVTNGLFSVSLDFGPDLFSGPARWLEIAVRTNGVGAPNTLVPRTPLLPTPYALFAGSAGNVADGSVTAAQLKTAGPAPAPGQFLSYAGGNLVWSDPSVAAGDVWSRKGVDAYSIRGTWASGRWGRSRLSR